MKSVSYALAGALGAVLLAAPQGALACSVCGVDGDPAFFWSFLFLVGMPFAVMGAIGGVFFYQTRREKAPPRSAAGA